MQKNPIPKCHHHATNFLGHHQRKDCRLRSLKRTAFVVIFVSDVPFAKWVGNAFVWNGKSYRWTLDHYPDVPAEWDHATKSVQSSSKNYSEKLFPISNKRCVKPICWYNQNVTDKQPTNQRKLFSRPQSTPPLMGQRWNCDCSEKIERTHLTCKHFSLSCTDSVLFTRKPRPRPLNQLNTTVMFQRLYSCFESSWMIAQTNTLSHLFLIQRKKNGGCWREVVVRNLRANVVLADIGGIELRYSASEVNNHENIRITDRI